MSRHLPPLIEKLLTGAGLPRAGKAPELIETHASWLLLTGEYAYKIKKPITLPFLDYGSLKKREACCRAEVDLNRRLAPTLYLDVVPIGGSPEHPELGALPAIEWAVRMHRFDEAGRLDRLVARGGLTTQHLAQLAAALCDFHTAAPRAATGSRFGAPANVLAAARENFIELRKLLPATDRHRIENLADWTEDEFSRHAAAFAARKRGGRIREGHGDLHLGNLVLIDGKVTPFDCIEFSDDLRWNDPASEIAFLWIDLLDHGAPGLAASFLNAWLESGGDFDAIPVLRFYAVYRAAVRAKVAALRAGQEEGAGRGNEVTAARRYLDLARKIAVPPAPTLTITCGLSGSGKTTASTARLSDGNAPDAGRLVRLRSDVERKRLFGLAPLAESGSAPDGGIYTAEATTRTYARLHDLAHTLLAEGWPVIVDAAFLRRSERDSFRQLAAQLGVDFAILYLHAEADELLRRVAARRGDASEATPAILERQRGWFEEPADLENRLIRSK